MLPSWIRSRNCRPRFVYFFAIETTSRRLASTSSFLACSACHSPRVIVSSVRRSRSGVSCSSSACALSVRPEILHALLEQLLVFLAQLEGLLALRRIELALDVLDLTLGALDGFDLVLDLLDHPALHQLGELDLADAPAQLDAGAQHLPARAAVLLLVLLRDRIELLLGLLHQRARLADGLDLAEHLALAILDLVVGELLVREGHQFADRALLVLQIVAELDHLLGDHRRSGDRLDDRELALLDALGDRHLALAGEQRHRAHLAQVHADRVVGLVECARRQVEFQLLAALGRTVEGLLVPESLVRVEHLDAGAAELVEQVVQFLGRGDFSRQQLVDFVVEKVALLLANVDELPYLVVLVFNRQGCPPCAQLRVVSR